MADEQSRDRTESYRVRKEYEGVYHVLDADDERVARVARFMPGSMVSVTGGRITPPALARAIARAMQRLAGDIERQRWT